MRLVSSELLPTSDWKDCAEKWDALCRTCHADHPLLSADWVGALLAHFSTRSTRIAYWAAMSGAEASTIVDLSSLKSVSFWPSQMPIVPLVGDTDVGIMGYRTLASRRLALRADLMRVDPLIIPVSALRHQAGSFITDAAQTMSVSLTDGWEAYWSTRSKNLRKQHRRFVHWLTADYPKWKTVVLTGEAEMSEAVTRYGRIEATGWKGRKGSAIAPGNSQDDFYTNVMEIFARKDEAAVFFLNNGHEDIAARLVIWRRGRAIILKTTYSEEYSRYRPGWIMLYEVLRWLCEKDEARSIEFYTNASNEQLRWATESRQIYHASLYRVALLRPLIEAIGVAKMLIRNASLTSKH